MPTAEVEHALAGLEGQHVAEALGEVQDVLAERMRFGPGGIVAAGAREDGVKHVVAFWGTPPNPRGGERRSWGDTPQAPRQGSPPAPPGCASEGALSPPAGESPCTPGIRTRWAARWRS